MATSFASVATIVTGRTRIMRFRALCATSDAKRMCLLAARVSVWWPLSGEL